MNARFKFWFTIAVCHIVIDVALKAMTPEPTALMRWLELPSWVWWIVAVAWAGILIDALTDA